MSAFPLRERLCLCLVRIMMFGDLTPAQLEDMKAAYHKLQMSDCDIGKDRSDSHENFAILLHR